LPTVGNTEGLTEEDDDSDGKSNEEENDELEEDDDSDNDSSGSEGDDSNDEEDANNGDEDENEDDDDGVPIDIPNIPENTVVVISSTYFDLSQLQVCHLYPRFLQANLLLRNIRWRHTQV
jgi:hypothetical protein